MQFVYYGLTIVVEAVDFVERTEPSESTVDATVMLSRLATLLIPRAGL
jgi:hypothetical protein